MWFWRISGLSCACLLSSIAATEASAEEYLLQPGDTLSLMIVGAPEMSRTIPIEMDGTAWFPVIGEIAVGEASLKDVRERVAQAYSATGIAQPTGPARFPEFVQPSQVYVGIDEYRPIYVTGGFLQPRTIDFRPGLTLRQVIALASVGGTGQGSQRAVSERLDSALVELSRVYARIWSLKRQLGTDTPEDYDNIFVADSPAIREIAELETAMIAAKTAEREQRKQVIEESIRRAESRLAALVEQKASEEEGWQLDEQIVAQVRELFNRNSPLAPASRLAEAKRSALVSASRVLQLQVTAENVRTELADLKAQASALDAGAESATWSELSDALTLAQAKRAELAVLQSAASAGVLEDEIVAVITRGDQLLPPMTADGPEQKLQPGDVVEIILPRPDSSRG
jgi:polysaccharide export outer membrane protein